MATTNLFGDPVFRDGAFTSNDAQVRALRAAEDDAVDRPRRGAGRDDVRVLGRARRRGDERGEGSAGGDQVVPRRDQLPVRVRAARRGTTSSSRSSRSRTSRAATSSCRRSATCSRSSTRSTTPTWSASTPKSRTTRWRGSTSRTASRRRSRRESCSTSTSTGRSPAASTRTMRFGSEDPKAAFFLVKLLEDSKWPGMRHFDSHAYRTEDQAGRVGLRARQHAHVPHPQGEGRASSTPTPRSRRCSAELRQRGATTGERVQVLAAMPPSRIKDEQFDLPAMRDQGYAYERLDQLTMELLLGVR